MKENKLLNSDKVIGELIHGMNVRLENPDFELYPGVLLWGDGDTMMCRNFDEMIADADAEGGSISEGLRVATEGHPEGVLGFMEDQFKVALGDYKNETFVFFRPGGAVGTRMPEDTTEETFVKRCEEMPPADPRKNIEVLMLEVHCSKRGPARFLSLVHREIDKTYLGEPMNIEQFAQYVEENGLQDEGLG